MRPFNFLGLRLWALVFLATILNAAPIGSAHGAVTLAPVLQGLSSPLYVTNAHDGTNRLFVVQQGGTIGVLLSGATATTLFLDITSKVLSGGEQGLLGLAFHPQFATNSRFFVNYTRQPDGATVVAEYRAMADPIATAASERIFLVIAQPFANHNGGMIEFGPDGYLYIGMGDGGSANDPGSRAQNINDLLGKILRIDVDHPAVPNLYSSPAGNPYAGATAGRDEIFAVGLRNPYRFSFDRGGTRALYVGDVGQGAVEEIDIVTAAGNYGWRVYEGTNCTGLDPGLCTPTNFVAPIAQYGHTGGRCSVTGGYVYRGSAAALPPGTYVYGDYCSGEIFSLQAGATSLLLDTTLNISSFGEDEAGEIYVVGLGGTVHRITAVASNATTTTLTGPSGPATGGTPVTFTATVMGANPTGSVSFTESGTALAGCSGVVLTGSGNSRTAICTTSSLAVGVHSIVANYGGDTGNATSSSAPLSQVINAAASASASLVASDLATQGNWKGRYGGEGYAIFGDSTSYPAYANVSPSGKADFTWAAQPSTDARALQRAATGRIAACWYGYDSFSVDLNLSDQATHRVATYLLDWDTNSRVTRVDVLDATTQQVLATQTLSAYHNGVYLVWDVKGHVTFRFTTLGGTNAVLSGLFFDSPAGAPPSTSASFVASDLATQGNWKGRYGSEGYAIFGDSTSYPAYANVSPSGKADFTWAAQPNTDARALQRAATDRIAACWYGYGSFSVDLNLSDQATHRVATYLLDWDTNSRVTRVDVLDATTQQVLATQTLFAYHNGVYLVWDVKGHVTFRFTTLGGTNAVLSGLFFDSPAGAPPSTSASFVASDLATQGNWKGRYGSEGYAIFGDSTSYPAYANVSPSGKADFTWAAQPNTDARALQRAATDRIAACWYGYGSFSVDLNLSDQATHRVATYLLDWDTNSRVTRVDVLDATTQQVLATQTLSAYHNGVYLVWDVKGHVTFRFTTLGGTNAVLSGLFFDAPAGAPTFSLSGTVSVSQ